MLLLIILILLLVGGGGFGYSRYGMAGGSGIVGTILVIMLILWLLGALRLALRSGRQARREHAVEAGFHFAREALGVEQGRRQPVGGQFRLQRGEALRLSRQFESQLF